MSVATVIAQRRWLRLACILSFYAYILLALFLGLTDQSTVGFRRLGSHIAVHDGSFICSIQRIPWKREPPNRGWEWFSTSESIIPLNPVRWGFEQGKRYTELLLPLWPAAFLMALPAMVGWRLLNPAMPGPYALTVGRYVLGALGYAALVVFVTPLVGALDTLWAFAERELISSLWWLTPLGGLVCADRMIAWGNRRFPRGCCWNCRYDLTGNVSGVCPECGTAVPGIFGAVSGGINVETKSS